MKFGSVTNFDNKEYIVVVLGNEKGGAGKTTTAMHLAMSLLSLGFKVATIDVDSRQKSLSRYIENRAITNKKAGDTLLMPRHFHIPVVNKDNPIERQQEEEKFFLDAFEHAKDCEFIIIDTPGNNTFLSSLAHSFADIIITPMNDSFIDLDVIAKVNSETLNVERPSHYSQTIWEQKMKRAGRNQESIEWIVLRNRLSNIDAKNKRFMTEVLGKLSQRIGFKHIHGFSERVIFRELFLQGLTLLDLISQKISLNLSHIAARQELKAFLKGIGLKRIDQALQNSDLWLHTKDLEPKEQPAAEEVA